MLEVFMENAERVAQVNRNMQEAANNFAPRDDRNPSGIRPTEFKVLILPDAVEEVSKGGIIIPVEKVDKDKYATTDGTIVAISHLAFSYATAEEWGDEKPKAGDRVAYAKYAGARRKGKDGKDYLLVNDKDVVAVIES